MLPLQRCLLNVEKEAQWVFLYSRTIFLPIQTLLKKSSRQFITSPYELHSALLLPLCRSQHNVFLKAIIVKDCRETPLFLLPFWQFISCFKVYGSQYLSTFFYSWRCVIRYFASMHGSPSDLLVLWWFILITEIRLRCRK